MPTQEIALGKEVVAAAGTSADMLWRLRIQVVTNDPTHPVTGHTLEVTCADLRTDDGGLTPLTASRTLDASGLAVLDIAHSGISVDARFLFVVRAPNGLPLAVSGPASASFAELMVLDPVVLVVEPVPANVLVAAAPTPQPRVLRARVVFRAGGAAKEQQVILYTSNATPLTRGSPGTPLTVATTDSTGSIRVTVPADTYASAWAIVGAAPQQTLPIPLDPDGRLPGFALLVIDAEAPEDADCGCADTTPRLPGQAELTGDAVYAQDIGGSCVNFTVPNRSIEEFTFNGIVRTTDPDGEAAPLVDDGFRWSGDPHDAAGYREFLRRTLRQPLDYNHRLDWDVPATRLPSIYQATTLAHGHVLTFKQVFKADGYSLGDLLYSLPLAPGQKKQIVVYDWNRADEAARSEALTEEERLEASLSRDRDLDEIVSGTLSEQLKGKSHAANVGAAGGYGAGGGSFSVSGGAAFAGSSQSGTRSLLASSHQHLRDRTMQSASAVRSQRATVVTSAAQGERMSVQTDVVANHNHCHAVTMQYFEVLRHFVIEQELADVQECLFVPLRMTSFDDAKILRWKECLKANLRGPRTLRAGFDALERITNNYVGSSFPTGAYADEPMVDFDGELDLDIRIAPPADTPDPADPGRFQLNLAAWTMYYQPYLRNVSWLEVLAAWQNPELAARANWFDEHIAPDIVAQVVDSIQVAVSAPRRTPLALDVTLDGTWRRGQTVKAHLRAIPDVTPRDIRRRAVSAVHVNLGFARGLFDAGLLRVVVRGGTLRYSTAVSRGTLFSSKIVDDLSPTDPTSVSTPVTPSELRRPRDEDQEAVARLRAHLNGQDLEYYHQVIWTRGMSPERRYMLLDRVHLSHPRYDATYAQRGVLGRSIASLVENRILGVAGNCLIFPVSPGYNIDPTFELGVPDPTNPTVVPASSLFEHYSPLATQGGGETLKFRVSVPTAGVFGEAVMGACNSCEKIDETRFWDWDKARTDEPTAIGTVSTDSRYQAPLSTTPTALPPAIVAMQAAPAAPDPTGLGAAMALLGKGDAFRDATGLAATQAAAVTAMTSNQAAALEYARLAKDVEVQKNTQKNAARMHQDVDTYFPKGSPENTAYHKRITEAELGIPAEDTRATSLVEAAREAARGAGSVRVRDGLREVEVTSQAATVEEAEAEAESSGGGGGGGSDPLYLRNDTLETVDLSERARQWLDALPITYDAASAVVNGRVRRNDQPPTLVAPVARTMILFLAAPDGQLQANVLHDVLTSFESLPPSVGALVLADLPGLDPFLVQKVEGDEDTFPFRVIEKWNGPSGTHQRTLELFLNRCLRAVADADQVVLIVGAHGAGVGEGGVFLNNLHNTQLAAFGDAVRRSLAAAGRDAFDLVVLDSCTDGMIEVATELQGSARTLLASEWYVWLRGHDYGRTFQRMSTMGWSLLPNAAVRAFGDNPTYATFVAVDLGQPLEDFLQAMEQLIQAAGNLPAADWSALVSAIRTGLQVPPTRITSGDHSMEHALDLASVIDALIDAAPDPVVTALLQGLKARYEAMILRREHRVNGLEVCNGLSIFVPTTRNITVEANYRRTAFDRRIGWLDFLMP